jgi:phage-related protein
MQENNPTIITQPGGIPFVQRADPELTTPQLQREVASLKELLRQEIDAIKTSITVAHDDLVRVPTEIQKQIANLKELFDTKLMQISADRDLVRTVIETRLNGMDKAIELLQHAADHFPARIDEKISALREVHDQKFVALLDTHSEKFSSIQTQFRERDVRTEQSSKDSKVAVDAALQAAKEAVGEQNKSSALAISKSESATVKQIDQQGLLITTATQGLRDMIDDVKERLTRIEGKGEGKTAAVTTAAVNSNYNVALIGLIIGSLIAIAGVIVAILLRPH